MTGPNSAAILMVGNMDAINKTPSHVSINIPAPAGSVMGINDGQIAHF